MTVRETNPTQYDLALQRGTKAIHHRWFLGTEARWRPAIDEWNAKHPVGSRVRTLGGGEWTVASGARLLREAPEVGPMFRARLAYGSELLPVADVDESWTEPESTAPETLARIASKRRPW